MHPHVKYLVELQAVDFRLIEIRDRLSKFPKRLAEVEARVAAARQQITAAKDALTTSLKERKTFEMDVEQWKERAKKYRNQSGEVKTNEAYKALQHEIQLAEGEVAKAEDRLLERMVSGEEFDRQVKAAEVAVKEIEAEANKERHAIQAEYNAAQKELAAAEAARAAAAAAVPEDLVDHYERIAKRHGGIGLAEIRGEGCGQCGVHIRPHVIQLLQRDGNDEIYHCETCTRILYYANHSAAPSSAPSNSLAADPAAPPARES
ncbi:MAG: zinc ribbon domain-containing protein [Candidatus Acidiferrales bacterium]